MALPPVPHDPTENLPLNAEALKAEVLRLREALNATQLEKERALRLLRSSNTDLFGRVQGQTRQLSQLNRLMNTINASLDLREVGKTALSGLHSLVGVEAVALIMRDSQSDLNYFMAIPDSYMVTLAAARPQLGEGVVGRVIATGQSYVDNDLSPGADLSPVDQATSFRFHSMLCEPLNARDSIIGAVQLVNKYSGPFVDTDRAFVETVAGSLSVAIENARNYTQAQTQLQALERAHAQLVETQTQLVESAKLASIGQLAAGLAHEINNPIGIILGFAQLMGQRALDEKLKSYAQAVEREAVRIRRIVSDLLGFARQTASETVRCDLRQIADTALRLVEYQLVKERIEVVRQFAPEPNWVMADSDQLLQVMMNLIQNARHAMPHGGALTLRTWPAEEMHFFSIADTGLGIPDTVVDQIFDPFFTTKPVGQGTGLGLSVSYGLVNRHGGQIRVKSPPGEGATFTISLPKAPDA